MHVLQRHRRSVLDRDRQVLLTGLSVFDDQCTAAGKRRYSPDEEEGNEHRGGDVSSSHSGCWVVEDG
ncbi:hypothetical protein [Haloarcula sp. CBA1122]|uniref:hypothetical protein n=1 Tax=Haloarcula sp. CBA1122 TaxID=2668069 RepID=UPI00352D9F7D